jgi:hypothetical protein
MTQSDLAHSLLHVHGLDGAHALPLAIVLGDFCLDAKWQKARRLLVLWPEGYAAVDGNLVVQECDFFDEVEQELPLAPGI